MNIRSTFFILVLFAASNVKCSNILCLFVLPSKSHTVLAGKLAEGLIERGHTVTIATPFYMESTKNLITIQLEKIKEYSDEFIKNTSKSEIGQLWSAFKMYEFGIRVNELFWADPAINKIIKEKPKYDLVIVSNFFDDALLGIAFHLGVPAIAFSPMGSSSLSSRYTANPIVPYVSNPFSETDTDTFVGRLSNMASIVFMDMMMKFVIEPLNAKTLQRLIPNAPSLEELRKNVSLVLLNSHVSIESPRPYVPNMVQIGGFHLHGAKELPTDIKNFLDDAKSGAILFSLGTNVKMNFLKDEQQEAIFKIFGEMAPMRVILKSELDHENVPKNVMVKNWLPQSDILGHPNLRLFVSHGGLGGNTESVYHGVPILGIPFFGDQKMNLRLAKSAGYAVVLEISELNEDTFRRELKKILENPEYTMNAKKRSALIKEQPIKPMDNAAFWIEHIIKYGGGSHLRNAGMDLTWYQLYMVDIYVFATLLIVLFFITIYYFIKLLKILAKIIRGRVMKVKMS